MDKIAKYKSAYAAHPKNCIFEYNSEWVSLYYIVLYIIIIIFINIIHSQSNSCKFHISIGRYNIHGKCIAANDQHIAVAAGEKLSMFDMHTKVLRNALCLEYPITDIAFIKHTEKSILATGSRDSSVSCKICLLCLHQLTLAYT